MVGGWVEGVGAALLRGVDGDRLGREQRWKRKRKRKRMLWTERGGEVLEEDPFFDGGIIEVVNDFERKYGAVQYSRPCVLNSYCTSSYSQSVNMVVMATYYTQCYWQNKRDTDQPALLNQVWIIYMALEQGGLMQRTEVAPSQYVLFCFFPTFLSPST